MLMTRSFMAVVALAIATSAGAQTLSFSRADYAATAAPRAIVAADFNRDGAMDLAMVNTGRDSVSILINGTAKGQGFVQTDEIVLGGGPFDVAAGDLNKDNVVDLVVANADLNTIDVILGKTAGGFEPPLHIAAAGNPRGVAIADLDGNGQQDIVYTQFYLDRVQVLHGDGSGNFTARIAALPTASRPQGIAIGRFESCCRPAIVVANTAANVLTHLRQTDRDKFQRLDTPGPSPTNVLTAGDFNHDGRLDVAAASSATNKVSLYRDLGDGFKSYGTFTAGSSPRGIEAADLNKDGYLDLVTANRAGNNVSIFVARPDANGWFNAPFAVAVGAGGRDVAVADFNSDGQVDLATANEFGNSATVLTNSMRPPASLFWEARTLPAGHWRSIFVAVADFNQNGRVDVLRSGGVLLDGTTNVPLSRGGSGSPPPSWQGVTGDFNGDGNADAAVVTFQSPVHPVRYALDLYYGNGAGGFQYAGSFGSFPQIYDVKAADVNADGRGDVVLAVGRDTGYGGHLHVLLGSTTGFVQQNAIEVSAAGEGVGLGDVNGDGKTDIVAAYGYQGPGVQIFLGDGTGAFSPGQFLTAARPGAIVLLGDVNHDGNLDILTSGGSRLTVWLGSDSGTFGAPGDYEEYNYSVVLADLTGDGHLDVFGGGGEGSLLRGRGDGTFGAQEPVNVVFDDAEAVDYDRDGRMDVVLVNEWHTMVLFSRAQRGPNFAPVAIAGPDVTYGYEHPFDDHECDSRGPSYDPNLDPLTFEWLDESGNVFRRQEVLCAPRLNPGTHTFTLVVRDAFGGESTDSKTITVTPFKEAVVYAAWSGSPSGAWRIVADSTAAGENRMWHPNAGAPKITTPLASPTHYFEASFLADPSQTYKVWIRLKAENNSWANDSVFVQFGDGAVVANGQTRYRAGTTDALEVNLEQCSGCGVSGWGWRDERWGAALNATPVLLRFPNGGWQRLIVQTREDGVSVDEMVFSAEKYLNAPPGPPKNDNTILPPRPW